MSVLEPPATLLVKLGSFIIHFEEYASEHGHDFDRIAAEQILQDPEVRNWLNGMDALALLPKKRI